MNESTAMMMLITFIENGKNSFKLIPLVDNCPYLECVFVPESKTLRTTHKDKKEYFQQPPDLSKQYVLFERYFENEIQNEKEIEFFVKQMTKSSFDLKRYL